MSEDWKIIVQEISTFRHYVQHLPGQAKEQAKYSFLITTEEINRLLQQKGHGTSLDGLRIYLGANMIENHLVPDIHIVACQKEGHLYDDFNVPKTMPRDEEKEMGGGNGGGSGTTYPCPAICGTSNILNS